MAKVSILAPNVDSDNVNSNFDMFNEEKKRGQPRRATRFLVSSV